MFVKPKLVSRIRENDDNSFTLQCRDCPSYPMIDSLPGRFKGIKHVKDAEVIPKRENAVLIVPKGYPPYSPDISTSSLSTTNVTTQLYPNNVSD
jgi:hypothetical protein